MAQYEALPSHNAPPISHRPMYLETIQSLPSKIFKIRRYLLVPLLLVILFLSLFASDTSNDSPATLKVHLLTITSKLKSSTDTLKLHIHKQLGYPTLKQSNLHAPGESTIWDNVGIEIKLGSSLEARLLDWESSPLLDPSDWIEHNSKVSEWRLFELFR